MITDDFSFPLRIFEIEGTFQRSPLLFTLGWTFIKIKAIFTFEAHFLNIKIFRRAFFYHSCTFSLFGDPVKDKSKIKGSLFLDRSENQPHPLSLPLKNQDQVFSWTLFRSNFYPFCLTFIKNLKTNLNPSLFTQNQTTLSLIKAKTKTKATFTQISTSLSKTSSPLTHPYLHPHPLKQTL